MKNYNKDQVPDESVYLKAETQPIKVDVPIIIHTRLQSGDGAVISAVDPDAAMMSEQFPREYCLTVYQSGAPVVTTVKQLVEEVLLSIKGEQL